MKRVFDFFDKNSLYIGLLIGALFLVCIGLMPYEDASFHTDNAYDFSEDWNYSIGEESAATAKLPTEISVEKGQKITLWKEIPSTNDELDCIAIPTIHQRITAYLNGEQIYTYGYEGTKYDIGQSPGNLWNLIDLPAGSSGKSLTIVLQSPYTECTGHIESIYIGTRSSLIFSFLESNLPTLILSILLMIFGLGYVFLYLFFHSTLQTNRSLVHLGLFSILFGLFFLGNSQLFQIYIPNPRLNYFLTNLCLMLLFIPIFQNVKAICGSFYAKFFRVLIGISYLITISIFFLQIVNILDLHYVLLYAIIAQAVLSLLGMGILLYVYLKERTKKTLTILIALDIFGAFALVGYFTKAYFLIIGALFFFLIQSGDVIKSVLLTIQRSREALRFEKLATTDMLTSLKNRTAYIQDCEKIKIPSSFAVVMADLNFLKTINDIHGHLQGDEAIRMVSTILRETSQELFSQRQYSCYRIGGDEFVILIHSCSEKNVQTLITRCEERMSKESKKLPFLFQLALGYALFEPEADTSVKDVARRADNRMYENKQALKASYNI